MNILKKDNDCPIRPSHIDTRKHFYNAFENHEREVSANWIVSFCREKNYDTWMPFPVDKLHQFHQAKYPGQDFQFNGLDRLGFVHIWYGLVHLTVEFVANCYKASPSEGAR